MVRRAVGLQHTYQDHFLLHGKVGRLEQLEDHADDGWIVKHLWLVEECRRSPTDLLREVASHDLEQRQVRGLGERILLQLAKDERQAVVVLELLLALGAAVLEELPNDLEGQHAHVLRLPIEQQEERRHATKLLNELSDLLWRAPKGREQHGQNVFELLVIVARLEAIQHCLHVLLKAVDLNVQANDLEQRGSESSEVRARWSSIRDNCIGRWLGLPQFTYTE